MNRNLCIGGGGRMPRTPYASRPVFEKSPGDIFEVQIGGMDE